MNKCNCYDVFTKLRWVGPDDYYYTTKYRCLGTPEMEECNCKGDETKCDFYPEKRKRALQKIASELYDTIGDEVDFYRYYILAKDLQDDALIKYEEWKKNHFNPNTSKVKVNKRDNIIRDCHKCRYEVGCYGNPIGCKDYKRDPPDGGYYG